jgi:hypothetical protein
MVIENIGIAVRPMQALFAVARAKNESDVGVQMFLARRFVASNNVSGKVWFLVDFPKLVTDPKKFISRWIYLNPKPRLRYLSLGIV